MAGYKGHKSYIFAGFSHRDTDAVLPILEKIQKKGFRIWYDPSEDNHTEFLPEVEEKLKKCEVLLFFLSPASTHSQACANMLQLALKHNKKIFAVYLQETELPKTLQFVLNFSDTLMGQAHSSTDDLLEEIFDAEILQAHRDLPVEQPQNSFLAEKTVEAYEGTENYIFVSYAHKDGATVIPIIEALQQANFRVWYDSGIEAGTEWPAYIEKHLIGSAAVLVFMSPSAVASKNCRNEINLAMDEKKETLVVYLQDTDLIEGMRLQLISLQSLFLNRHASTETFLEELFKSKILRTCLIGNEAPKVSSIPKISIPPVSPAPSPTTAPTPPPSGALGREAIKESRKNSPALISRVGAKGSTSATDFWPLTPSSHKIDIQKYSNVMFQCYLLRPFEIEGVRSIGLQIFDSEDTLIYENIVELSFSETDNKFAMAWSVNPEDGVPVAEGQYNALLWVENSRVAEYSLQLFDSASPLNAEGEVISAASEAEIAELTKKLQFPKMALTSIFLSIMFFFTVAVWAGSSSDGALVFLGIIFTLVTILLARSLYKLTKKNITPQTILALLLVAFNGYYGIYLIIMAVITLGSRRKWKARIKELKS